MREEALREVSRELLETLLLERARMDEDFALWLDVQLLAAQPQEAGKRLDPASFRRRTEALLSGAGSARRRRHWEGWESEIDEAALAALINSAVPFLAGGRGKDALVILKAVAEPLVDHWPEVAEWDETLHALFPQLDDLIAQAVLMQDVSAEVRGEFLDELSDWQDQIADYGLEDVFATAMAACAGGWEAPDLEDVLAGHREIWPPEEADASAEEDLIPARLAALDVTGQVEAYLHFARAAGLHQAQAVKLVQIGRIDEALALARAQLSAPDDIRSVAAALAEAGQRDAGLDLAAWGLKLPPRSEAAERWWRPENKIGLARWLRETAREAGRREMMLTAAQAAFEESLEPEDFQRARELAGASAWPELRERLLAALLAAPTAFSRIAILLDEGRIDDAVGSVDPREARFFHRPEGVLQRLAEEAHADHPDWTITLAFAIADPIMEEARSNHYEEAAGWLAIAARAYAANGRTDEWQVRLEELIEIHRRKYRLRPLLEALRISVE